MMHFDPETKILYMQRHDAEHCGFDTTPNGDFEQEIFLSCLERKYGDAPLHPSKIIIEWWA